MQVIQKSIIEKAKDFISKHKGKLIAAAAIGGAGFLGYKLGHSNTNDTKNITNINITINRYNKSPTDTKSPVNDTQHIGTQHIGTQHTGTQHTGTQHIGTQHTGTQHTDAQHTDTQHTDTQLNFGSSDIVNNIKRDF